MRRVDVSAGTGSPNWLRVRLNVAESRAAAAEYTARVSVPVARRRIAISVTPTVSTLMLSAASTVTEMESFCSPSTGADVRNRTRGGVLSWAGARATIDTTGE